MCLSCVSSVYFFARLAKMNLCFTYVIFTFIRAVLDYCWCLGVYYCILQHCSAPGIKHSPDSSGLFVAPVAVPPPRPLKVGRLSLL